MARRPATKATNRDPERLAKFYADALDERAPAIVLWLDAVRRGSVFGMSSADRMTAAKMLLDKAPMIQRMEAEIERAKTAPVIASDAPKGYVRTAFRAPGDAVDADAS